MTRTRECSRETLRRAEPAQRIPPNVQTSCGIGHVACGGNAFGGSALLLRKHRGGGDSPTHPPPPAAEGRSRRSGIASKTSTAIRRRSEEHTSELPSLIRISYASFCLTQLRQ